MFSTFCRRLRLPLERRPRLGQANFPEVPTTTNTRVAISVSRLEGSRRVFPSRRRPQTSLTQKPMDLEVRAVVSATPRPTPPKPKTCLRSTNLDQDTLLSRSFRLQSKRKRKCRRPSSTSVITPITDFLPIQTHSTSIINSSSNNNNKSRCTRCTRPGFGRSLPLPSRATMALTTLVLLRLNIGVTTTKPPSRHRGRAQPQPRVLPRRQPSPCSTLLRPPQASRATI